MRLYLVLVIIIFATSTTSKHLKKTGPKVVPWKKFGGAHWTLKQRRVKMGLEKDCISGLGIDIGSDFITVATSSDVKSTYRILSIEGDPDYKLYMRQNLHNSSRQSLFHIPNARIHPETRDLFRNNLEYHPAVSKSHLKHIFKGIENDLIRAIGESVMAMSVTVSLPIGMSTHSREDIRHTLEAAGFGVQSASAKPLLAARIHAGVDKKLDQGSRSTFLVVDYNRASLDVAIVHFSETVPGILAKASFPSLGQDTLDLQIAAIMLKEGAKSESSEVIFKGARLLETFSPRRLRNVAGRFRTSKLFQTRTGISESVFLTSCGVQEHFYMDQSAAIERLVASTLASMRRHGRKKSPHFLTSSSLIVTGDADSGSLEVLKNCLTRSRSIAGLVFDRPLDDSSVAARGAALAARADMAPGRPASAKGFKMGWVGIQTANASCTYCDDLPRQISLPKDSMATVQAKVPPSRGTPMPYHGELSVPLSARTTYHLPHSVMSKESRRPSKRLPLSLEGGVRPNLDIGIRL